MMGTNVKILEDYFNGDLPEIYQCPYKTWKRFFVKTLQWRFCGVVSVLCDQVLVKWLVS